MQEEDASEGDEADEEEGAGEEEGVCLESGCEEGEDLQTSPEDEKQESGEVKGDISGFNEDYTL